MQPAALLKRSKIAGKGIMACGEARIGGQQVPGLLPEATGLAANDFRFQDKLTGWRFEGHFLIQ